MLEQSNITAIESELLDFNVFALPSMPMNDLEMLPSCSGIYFVVHETSVLYVGKSNNIQNRWKGHHILPRLGGYPDAVLHWMEVHAKDHLVKIETFLIHRFNPPLNSQVFPLQRLGDLDALDKAQSELITTKDELRIATARLDDFVYAHRALESATASLEVEQKISEIKAYETSVWAIIVQMKREIEKLACDAETEFGLGIDSLRQGCDFTPSTIDDGFINQVRSVKQCFQSCFEILERIGDQIDVKSPVKPEIQISSRRTSLRSSSLRKSRPKAQQENEQSA